ncbi:MAG TPA: hypothetical protein VIF62_11295 [Labilithrix sp.]|jgi:hypothetical protein
MSRLRAATTLVAIGAFAVGCRRADKRDQGVALDASSADANLDAALARLGDAARCGATDRSPIWCDVVERWSTASGEPLGSTRVLVGLRVPVDPTGVASAVQHRARLVAVAIDPDSGTPRASITELLPESAAEREELARALDEIQPVLAGTSASAKLGPHLFDFVTRAWNASHPLEAAPHGWRFRGRHPTELRRIGRSWASIETVSVEPPRYLISILTANVERGGNPP